MKGWIELTVKYDYDLGEEYERNINLGLIKEEPKTYWKKNLIQVSNINGITWMEETEHNISNGNALLHVEGTSIEVKEAYREVIRLIMKDQERL